MSLTPIPIHPQTRDGLVRGYGLMSRGMVDIVHTCPECHQLILVCDNGWLNAQPLAPSHKDYDVACGVTKMGPLTMMVGGAVDGGSRHMVHDHQPDG